MTMNRRFVHMNIWLVLALLPACTTPGEVEPPQSTFQLIEAGIEEIQTAYEAGTLTAVELVQAYLDRIAAYDLNGPAITSIISVHPDALSRAAALDEEAAAERPPRPPARHPGSAEGQHQYGRSPDDQRFRRVAWDRPAG